MIKVALYGLVGARRGVGVLPCGSACSCSAWARCRRSAASSTRSSARPRTAAGAALDRERRDHRARDRSVSRSASARSRGLGGIRLAAALLHTLNHAIFKALLFLGAGVFERAAGSLEIDRLGGLLRRMPWSGGAYLVGAMAIAGLPPLNGFARPPPPGAAARSHGGRRRRQDRGRGRARGARRDGGARRLLLRQGRRTRSARPAAGSRRCRRGGTARSRCGHRSPLAGACVLLGLAPGLLFGSLVGVAPWASVSTQVGLDLPTTGLPHRRDRAGARGLDRRLALLRGAGARRLPPPSLRLPEPARLDERGLT